MGETKLCSKCKVLKPTTEFSNKAAAGDGLYAYCKPCDNERSKKYYYLNKEGRKEWRQKNKEDQKEYQKEYRQKNKERIAIYRNKYNKEWRQNNKVYTKEYNRKRYLTSSIRQVYLIPKYEGIPCLDCGGVFQYCSMHFDHRPGEVKSFNIANKCCLNTTPNTIDMIEAEINKCDFVCANCHAVRTWKRKQI